MNKSSIIHIVLFSLLFILFLFSCKHKEESYHTITDKIEAKSKHYNGISISSEIHTDHMETFEISEDGLTFFIPDRKGKIQSYACTECHTKPLEKRQQAAIKKAHWNIKLHHASKEIMNCTTCHNKKNMDNLISITEHSIDFNKSYKLCSQCHQEQSKDWLGGAHGKSIGSWAPPRVSMTCVNCHNPHNPSISSKWPVRLNTQKIKERK